MKKVPGGMNRSQRLVEVMYHGMGGGGEGLKGSIGWG